MKRGYLLPKGCKDLIDALKLTGPPKSKEPPDSEPAPLPQIGGEIVVAPVMSVTQLADALGQEPYRIIADLMDVHIFAAVNQEIDFDVMSEIVRKYGFTPKKSA